VKTQAREAGTARPTVGLDLWLLMPDAMLVGIGIVMVGSASIAVAEGQQLAVQHYLVRHCVYVVLGIALALGFRIMPIAVLTTGIYMVVTLVLLLRAHRRWQKMRRQAVAPPEADLAPQQSAVRLSAAAVPIPVEESVRPR